MSFKRKHNDVNVDEKKSNEDYLGTI